MYVGGDVVVGRDVAAGRDVRAEVDLEAGRDALVSRDMRAGRDMRASRDIHASRDMNVGRNASVGQDVDVDRDASIGRDLTVHRNLTVVDSSSSSTLNQKEGTLNCATDQLNISKGWLRSKGLTGSQGKTVGHEITKDMGTTSCESLAAARAPNNVEIVGGVSSSFWDDWGQDIFDDWGYFYIFDVATSQYYFPILSPRNLADGVLTTQNFTAFGRTYTIVHGFVAQGIFKFDVSCSDDSEFIFGAYGDMGSDSSTENTNLTHAYSVEGESLTLYYNRNVETGDEVERFFSYFIPYDPLLSTSKTYNDFVDGDELSLYSVPVTKGLTVYFAKKNDVRDWVINDITMGPRDFDNGSMLNVDGDTSVRGTLDAARIFALGVYLVPPGTIVTYISNTIPAGWLACDGSSYLRSQYPELFSVISTTFGGTSTTFNVPDLRGRTVVGVGSGVGLTARALASTGGAETHTLTTAELPSHSHSGTTSADGAHSHTHNANGGNDGLGLVQDTNTNTVINTDSSSNEFNAWQLPQALTINSAGSHSHTFTTSSEGGGAPHNIMQPYIVLTYIIKN